jgi:cytochrome b involved in lipid metabolism
MRLTQQQPSLTGLAGRPPRLTMEEVQRHNSPDDAWIVIRGKAWHPVVKYRVDAWLFTCARSQVYNITPYFSYHPGGAEELMRGAGSDGTALFDEVHRWVNVEYMLAKAYIGELLPPEPVTEPVVAGGGSSSSEITMPIDVWTGCTVESVSVANESGDMITVRLHLPPGMVLVRSVSGFAHGFPMFTVV